jgi:isocitrate lyase
MHNDDNDEMVVARVDIREPELETDEIDEIDEKFLFDISDFQICEK